MGQIAVGVWNMEWLNDLFVSGDGPAAFKSDQSQVRGPEIFTLQGPRKPTVGERKEKLRAGISDLDLDLLVVVEGPNRGVELRLLFDELAPGTWQTFLQESKTQSRPDSHHLFSSQQNIGIALRLDRGRFADQPLRVFDAMEPNSGLIHSASEPFFFDTGDDKVPEWFRYERRPLYVEVALADGAAFRVLGLHLKSKGIFSAYEWSRWWAMADANRERLLAQCRHLREEFLDRYLTDEETREIPLLVCGDINDGPGFDASEAKLKASGVETLMGSVWKPELTLRNALFDSLSANERDRIDLSSLSTTRFPDPIFNDTYHYVWIDHILYSQSRRLGQWVKDANIKKRLDDSTYYYRISDHYPIIAQVSLEP
jgi:endonuclease/exonuclease/phosphatase family metal-dependent hydrolase